MSFSVLKKQLMGALFRGLAGAVNTLVAIGADTIPGLLLQFFSHGQVDFYDPPFSVQYGDKVGHGVEGLNPEISLCPEHFFCFSALFIKLELVKSQFQCNVEIMTIERLCDIAIRIGGFCFFNCGFI